MKLTKRTKDDGTPFWACETTISERHVPKAAGFKWSGKFWWSDEIKDAAKLKEFADEECKSELEAVKVNSRSAAKVEAMKAEVEAEKNMRMKEAAEREAEKKAQAAIWQKEKDAKAMSKQEYFQAIRSTPFVIAGNTYMIKDELKELGCKWDMDRKSWVALDEDTFNQGMALLGAHDKSHPHIMRWYHEGSVFGDGGPNKFFVGEVLRHDGGIWTVERAWSSEWESEDWNHHATLRPATEAEQEQLIEREAEQRRELVEQEAKRLQESAQANLFKSIAKDENYSTPNMLKDENGHEYPEQLVLDGERINVGEGPTIYGGGKWFVLTEDKIWAVAGNGHDGDDWSLNNIGTGGAGSIGYCVPRNEALAEVIRHAADVSNFMEKADLRVAHQDMEEAARDDDEESDEEEDEQDTEEEEITPERQAIRDLLTAENEDEDCQGASEAERE